MKFILKIFPVIISTTVFLSQLVFPLSQLPFLIQKTVYADTPIDPTRVQKTEITCTSPSCPPSFDTFQTAFNGGNVIAIDGDLSLSSSSVDLSSPTITPNKTTVLFVQGNLSINNNITYGNNNSGLVFVVKGNVNIAPSVTKIDAVIIAQGTIYTAGAGCSHLSPVPVISRLDINGSLIALSADKPIEFCRTLGINNSNTPAERITQQSKYLVILRNIYSDTVQKWSEIQ